MKGPDRYLKQRNGRWTYVRRVPQKAAETDLRGTIRVALETGDLVEARLKRDALEAADDLFWSGIRRGDTDGLMKRYQGAVSRAIATGFSYKTLDTLATNRDVPDLLNRLNAVEQQGRYTGPMAEALLGGVEKPSLTLRQAFGVYEEVIAVGRLTNKSPKQKNTWRKPKLRAVNNFVRLNGDVPIAEITREQAQKFHQWWQARITRPGAEGGAPLSDDTASRDMGNLRGLFQDYFNYMGEEARPNPFRNLTFEPQKRRKIPPFDVDWITSKILQNGALSKLNDDARHIVYVLAETPTRPSEICNLLAENIKLDCDVPHLVIADREDREIKTLPSEREIPLVGIALEAMKKHAQGFPRYYDKEDSLSATLMKAFRSAKLFPTPNHRIYSFRHSYEKRMLEAGLDYGLRCLLMGHANDRPDYGDGGSLEYRRDEMLKIVMPFDPALV